MTQHHLDDSQIQPFWDNSVAPRLTVAPGDTVVVECLEATGQLSPTSTVADYLSVDRSRVHALNGPIAIDGARPGQVVEIEILEMAHKGWGWTGHKPGFGLLDGDFDAAYLHHWRLDGDACHFGRHGIVVPYDPMPGCLGVAPAEPGRLDTTPPRQNGGNVDIRDITTGSTVWLPVLAPGALLGIGDCHAAQGQGEVCGTGIECPMTVTIRLDLRDDMEIRELQYRHRRAETRHGPVGWHGTSAHGPDLYQNAQNAVRYMIDWLMATHGLSAEEAYALCSVATDLQIAEVVDRPNWIVTARMPLSIFA